MMYGIHSEGKLEQYPKKWEHCSYCEENCEVAVHKVKLVTMLYRTTSVLRFSVLLTNFTKGQTLFLCFLARNV